MTTLITTLPPILLAFVTVVALLAIGVLIWSALPRRDRRKADIERQIATLRRHADHAVQTRPRVRANSCHAVQTRPRVRANSCHAVPGHIKAAPPANASKPKACGGGLCRHRADCSDHYCPGRLSANLTGTHRP